jgi:hypothetical protein
MSINHFEPNRRRRQQRNEGEGNRTAARQFNEAQREFVEDESWKPEARKAAQALDSAHEGEELRQAEEKARAKAGPDANR